MRTRGGTTTSLPRHQVWPALVVLAAVIAAALLVLMPGPAYASWASDQVMFTDISEPVVIKPAADPGQDITPRVTSKAAIVVDMETGAVLYSRNADKRLEMASTTKMMTAILILESLPLDKVIKVPAAAVGTSGSALGLQRGESFTVEELLYMLLVPSANDAAITLAVAEAGSVKAFVAKMNERAQEMGLKNTHFENAWGLHVEDHYSSASDLTKIAAVAMRDPLFRKIVSTKEFTLGAKTVGGVRDRVIKNSNELLQDYDWVNGIKTGSTPWAGYCLVASATKDGLTLISVVLGAKDQDTREMESRALLEYGFEHCRMQNLVDGGAIVAELPVADCLDRTVRLVTAAPFARRLLGDGEVTAQVKLAKKVKLPVAAGQLLGELELLQDETTIGSVPIIAAQTVELATLRMIMEHWNGPWAQRLPLMLMLEAAKS